MGVQEYMRDLIDSPLSWGMLVLSVILGLGIAMMEPTLWLLVPASIIILLIGFHSPPTALVLVVVSMLFSPEIVVGGYVGKGVGGRPVTLRLEDLILIVIGFSWLLKVLLYKDIPVFKWTPVNRPILYYLLVCLCSTLIGILTGEVKPTAGFFHLLKYFEYFFLFFMVVNHILRNDQVVSLGVVLLLTCFLVSVYSISQIPGGGRATAPFEGEIGEPNTLGGYLVFMMAIVIGLLLYLESLPIRVLLLGLLVCILLGIFPTLSRASYLAAAVLPISIIVTQWRRPWVVMAAVGAVLMVGLLAPTNVKERLLFTIDQPRNSGQIVVGSYRIDTSTSERIEAWRRSIETWRVRPLLGHGVASTWWADAQYVKVLVESGLLGIGSFLLIMVRLWKGAKESFQNVQSPFYKGLAYGFLLGFVSLLVHAIGANTFVIVRIMEPFWLVAALVMLLPTLEKTAVGLTVTQEDIQSAA
jgi:O-antigen ligase